ncbi:hypothetical protein Tco_1072066 [Tanacetum coccineum]
MNDTGMESIDLIQKSTEALGDDLRTNSPATFLDDQDLVNVEDPSMVLLVKLKDVNSMIIMEYLVKISKKARILELKRRHLKITDSDIQYAVSIKEDTVGCSEWPTYSWRENGYYNGGNLPGAYIVRNSLHYQDLEWYEALEDGELKEEALKNKAIIEGIIVEDDESSNEGWRRWDDYEITNRDHEEREFEMEHDNEGRCELFDNHELPVCNIRKFDMIKYSFGDDEKYVAIKEDEYDDLTSTSKDACRFMDTANRLHIVLDYQDLIKVEDPSMMLLAKLKDMNSMSNMYVIYKNKDVNGMEKVEDSIEENSLADLNNLNDLKETINKLASNEIQHPIRK